MGMASLSFDKIVKQYPGNLNKTLDGISLEVGSGEFLVLVGPSGCGKSTLLRTIAGLESITSGTLRIGDRVVNDVHPKDRDIAMVFQSYALYPHMTVRRNMGFGLEVRKTPRAEIDKLVGQAAEMLGLGLHLEKLPKALSGGQRQRVAMGRAIVRQPQVFLFDEPLSNLDAKLRAQTRLEIQKLHRELGVTSLFVTHDQVEAMTLAERMIVMNAGRIEQIGTPEQVYGTPATTFVASFIGSPPMNLLPGRADGSRFTVGEHVLALPAAAPRAGELLMGVRPEHAELSGANGGWPLKVEVLEMLGAERLVHGLLGGAPFTLRIDGTLVPPHAGDTVHLRVEPAHLHWFDATSGKRLA
jgi:sn-glycerol 3-phosphate transport system ATP-binding protein